MDSVVISDLSKSFGRNHAVKGVSMSIKAGTVHALVGENGAGKSTTLGIMAGRIAPTSGRVDVFGEELKYGDPRSCRKAGVVAIYQELTIVPALTAEANVFLAAPMSKAGFLATGNMRTRYLELCERAGVRAVPAGTPAGSLSVAEQQVLEILRALVSDARVILFDEPTASLAENERASLFRLMRTLRSEGVAMVLVSHNLDEVLDIADEITVFRDGRLTLTADRGHFTKENLVEAMIGKSGDDRLAAQLLDADAPVPTEAMPTARVPSARAASTTEPVLVAEGVTVPGAIENVDIEVRAGEVVGVGGLVGAGRTTLLRALAGLERTATGRMWIDGNEVAWPKTVRKALRYGIALLPEDRKGQGLVLSMTVADNIALSGFGKTSRWGMVTPKSVRSTVTDSGTAFGLSPELLERRASELSGGNQQKLLLARWMHRTPRILLADEPTRGIDVGAKAEIVRSLEGMALDGLGLVIVSSELEEVVAVADRVVVLSEGRHVGTLDSADGGITTSDILGLAFRVRDSA
ncbi:sugar ABC transporter ATP-binding protein [Rhodococcus sp. 14-2496-1d]|uniref:sugar ABC transporter ATP-binding protein n=1 Tax=Rhodococcus sp. 14-2496-1d TaxID=2023146 RepID=UPI000B9C6474|nr:sugar ABC transporter ATP-binding protein [Rhodococcus sp. 14-2496-1d]OZF25706.1 sugar ABC transporter ATP-binding protein [Rhodococcus sp. 14-2496-1d]